MAVDIGKKEVFFLTVVFVAKILVSGKQLVSLCSFYGALNGSL